MNEESQDREPEVEMKPETSGEPAERRRETEPTTQSSKRSQAVNYGSVAVVLAALAVVYLLLVFGRNPGGPTGSVRLLTGPRDVQPPEPGVTVTRVSEIPMPGPPRSITTQGDATYVALAMAGFATLDTSEPGRPLLTGIETDPRGVFVLKVFPDGDRLFALDRVRGIVRYDLSDPLDPEYEWNKLLPGNAADQAVAMVGHEGYYYFACGGAGVRMAPKDFDVETTAPQVLEFYDHPSELRIYEPHWLGVAAGRSTPLQVLSLEDPTSPTLAASVHIDQGFGESLEQVGEVSALYLRPAFLLTLNMDQPNRPVMLNLHTMPAMHPKGGMLVKSSTTWKDRYLILGNHFGYIEIFDMGDPEQPVLEGTFDVPGTITALGTVGDYLYAGIFDERKLVVLKLSEREESVTTAGGAPAGLEAGDEEGRAEARMEASRREAGRG